MKQLLIILIILLNIHTVSALEFTQNPALNDNQRPYLTNQSLNCGWEATGFDTYSIKWFKGDTELLNYEPGFDNQTIVLSSSISRGNRWICEVTITNATDSVSQNSSQAHFAPWLSYPNGTIIPDEFNLTEDQITTLFINSADPSDLSVTFRLDQQIPEGVCSLISTTTGEISCMPQHIHVAGTEDPAPESITSFRLEFEERAGGNSFGTVKLFDLIPVNDQAEFVGEYDNVTITADDVWTLNITGVDEELDFPLNFTLVSTLPESLSLEVINDTTARLFFATVGPFEGMPTNDAVGNWTIQINVTDSFGSNSSRSPSSIDFNLEITSTNFPPNITSNLSELPSGVQNQNYTAIITASDPDQDDVLSLFITLPEDPDYQFNCTAAMFPWQDDIVVIDNSSNATFMINTTLTNDHVACRYVDIEIYDGQARSFERNVFLDIINVNDPPSLHEVGINGNMSNQSSFVLGNFIYQLNATDPDQLTYDFLQTGTLTYYSNDSERFPVDPNTGLINVTILNSSYIGTWQINYTVSDGEYNDSRIMTLEITSNNAPILNMSLANINYYQNESILIEFQGIELDGENISINVDSLTDFNTSIYQNIIIQNNTIAGINYFNFTINMTRSVVFEANSQVGFHSINISLTDEKGTFNQSSNQIFNFTILNTNDAPFFVHPSNTLLNYDIVLENIVVNRPVNKTIYAQDFDLLIPPEFGSEELTYMVSDPSQNINNLQIIKIDGTQTQARLLFTPETVGNASFLIRVTDSQGAFEEQNVSFEILPITSEPEITHIKPFVDGQITNFTAFTPKGNKTFEEPSVLINTTTQFHSSCQYALVTQEPHSDQPFVFDAQITLDNDTDPDNFANFEWYVDGILVANLTNVTPGVNSSYTFEDNINLSMTRNVSVKVIDSRGSFTTFDWQFATNILPRPPFACPDGFPDIEISSTTQLPDYFSYAPHPEITGSTVRFYTPDEDLNMDGIRNGENEPTTLTYGVLNAGNCGIVTFSYSGDMLTLAPQTTGVCNVRFTATNPNGEVATSEEITITVVDFIPEPPNPVPVSTPRPVPIPFQEDVDVPKPLNILFPSNASLFSNQTIELPIIIENTYTEEIRGISLSALMPDHPEMTYSFTVDFIASLGVGQTAYTLLTVENFRDEEAPYELRVNVSVAEPEFKDTASILVAGLEQSGAGDDRQVRVTFARDLLAENPECQELNDYLSEAQQMLERGEVQAAGDLVNIIINGCRTLVRGEELRIENPGLVRRAYDFSDEFSTQIITWVAILTILTIGIYVMLSVKEKLLKEV